VSTRKIWVGGYSDDMNGSAEGITLVTAGADGSLENHGLAVAADSPSYLARSGDTLYAACEGSGTVTAYRIAGSELHFLGLQDAAGELPCSLAVLGDRSALAVACYRDGIVDIHPLSADGAVQKTAQTLLGVGKSSLLEQDGPHAHAALEVDATTVLTTDLGTDDIYIHTRDGEFLDRTGSVRLPAGSGPRDLLLYHSHVVWVLAELSQEIFILLRSADGFEVVDVVALPGAEAGDRAAGLALSADGRFAYAGLRGSDNIAVFGVRSGGVALTPLGFVGSGGGWPRHLVVDGDYLHVANQLSNSVVTFTIGDDGIPVRHSSLVVHSPTFLLLD
jgi:6-phosphogluconolactonase